jgi:hypothetical protein
MDFYAYASRGSAASVAAAAFTASAASVPAASGGPASAPAIADPSAFPGAAFTASAPAIAAAPSPGAASVPAAGVGTGEHVPAIPELLSRPAPAVVPKEDTENYVARHLGKVPESRFALDTRTFVYVAWCAQLRRFIIFPTPLSLRVFAPNNERLRKLSPETVRYKLLTSPTLKWSHVETWATGSAREYVQDRISILTSELTAAGFENADTKLAAVKFPKGISAKEREEFNQRTLGRRTAGKRQAANREYRQKNAQYLNAMQKRRRLGKVPANVASEMRRRGKTFLTIKSNAALQKMGGFEEMEFPAPVVSNPGTARGRRVKQAHCFFDIYGNMHYIEDAGENIMAVERMLAASPRVIIDKKLLSAKGVNQGSILLRDITVSPQRVFAPAAEPVSA